MTQSSGTDSTDPTAVDGSATDPSAPGPSATNPGGTDPTPTTDGSATDPTPTTDGSATDPGAGDDRLDSVSETIDEARAAARTLADQDVIDPDAVEAPRENAGDEVTGPDDGSDVSGLEPPSADRAR